MLAASMHSISGGPQGMVEDYELQGFEEANANSRGMTAINPAYRALTRPMSLKRWKMKRCYRTFWLASQKPTTWIFWDWGCLDFTCRTMNRTWTRTGHLWRFCFSYPTSWSLWYCRLLWRVKGGETQSLYKSDTLCYTCQEGCSISDCKFSISLSPLQSFASNIHVVGVYALKAWEPIRWTPKTNTLIW